MEQATELVDRAEVSDGKVIVEYSRTEAALAELRGKYENVAYDLSTTAGDKAARAARLELVTLRGTLEKTRKELKAPALDFGKRIDSEAARINGEIIALEAPIDQQIKADEQRRAEEKARLARIEAERVEGIKAKIATIRGFVAKAQGISSERVSKGIDMVTSLRITQDEFAEFEAEATAAQQETLKAMRELHAAAVDREAEAARLEAQRIENERVAAEQKRIADEQAARQAELDRQAAEIRAAREQAEREEAARAAAAQAPAGPAPAPAQPTHVAANVTPIRAAAPQPQRSAPTMTLGTINTRLAGVTVSSAFLATLGFEATTDKNAKLYAEADFPAICQALIDHINRASEPLAA